MGDYTRVSSFDNDVETNSQAERPDSIFTDLDNLFTHILRFIAFMIFGIIFFVLAFVYTFRGIVPEPKYILIFYPYGSASFVIAFMIVQKGTTRFFRNIWLPRRVRYTSFYIMTFFILMLYSLFAVYYTSLAKKSRYILPPIFTVQMLVLVLDMLGCISCCFSSC